MPLYSQSNGSTTKIHISGRFDFKLHSEFREAYRYCPQRTSYVVDLGATEYIDSSALGMLLVLREHAGGDHAMIRIENTRPSVRKILQIAHFERFFEVA